jgi:hypothetical protein
MSITPEGYNPSDSPYLAPHHLAELQASGIDSEIARRNFITLEDSAEVDRLLNRNSDQRWRHSTDLVPGWAVHGVDPKTGELTSLGAQYKPDHPRLGDNGKPRKYESAAGYPTTPLFLDTGKAEYWLQVLRSVLMFLILTEGAKKAASLLSMGFAAISIPGVASGQKLGDLKAELKQYCQVGRTVYLAFDLDLMTNPQVCRALDQLGRLIAAEGAVVKVILLPGPEKGIDDFAVARGRAAVLALIEDAVPFEQWRKMLREQSSNLLFHPAGTGMTLSTAQLTAKVDELILQDLPQSELEALVPELAQKSGRQSRDVWALLRAKEKEHEQAVQRAEAIAQGLPALSEVRSQRLTLRDFLWGDQGVLANQLLEVAKAMPTTPEFLLTTLIAVAGSRIGAGTKVVIKASAQYTQPAIYRTMIVAPTGFKKTPTQSVIIEPLKVLESEEHQKWQEADNRYKQEVAAAARKKPKDTEPPTPPPPRTRRIMEDNTIEARIRIHSENPRGFLIYRDEGAAHFTARNKYRNGLGDDAQIELSEFNGGSLSKDRAVHSIYVPWTAISRTGSIQGATLQELMKNHDDTTGEWARWLFCATPAPPSKIDLLSADAELDIGVAESLRQLYLRLEEMKPANYLLSHEAKVIFQEYQHMLIDWQIEENHDGLRNAYPKFESYLSRLALWLHLVNAALAGLQPETLISEATMIQAVALTDYFIGQLRLIYTHNSPTSGLTSILLEMQEYSERKGIGLVARDFKMGMQLLKKVPTTEIRDYMQTLVESGYGKFEGNEYWANPVDSVDAC